MKIFLAQFETTPTPHNPAHGKVSQAHATLWVRAENAREAKWAAISHLKHNHWEYLEQALEPTECFLGDFPADLQKFFRHAQQHGIGAYLVPQGNPESN